jgi:hypothetical protein
MSNQHEIPPDDCSPYNIQTDVSKNPMPGSSATWATPRLARWQSYIAQDAQVNEERVLLADKLRGRQRKSDDNARQLEAAIAPGADAKGK